MKRCSRCKVEKDLNDFYRKNTHGRRSQCKDCDKERYERMKSKVSKPRKCTKCDLMKSGDEFYVSRSECKECAKILDKESYERRKSKVSKPRKCIKCDLMKSGDEFYAIKNECITCCSNKYKSNKDYSIYVIKYDNEVLYVGSTYNSTSRMINYNTNPYNVNHLSHTRPIARFIREHIEKGTISNHFEIIESDVPEEKLRVLEQYYIDLYDTPLNARNVDGTSREVREVKTKNKGKL